MRNFNRRNNNCFDFISIPHIILSGIVVIVIIIFFL